MSGAVEGSPPAGPMFKISNLLGIRFIRSMMRMGNRVVEESGEFIPRRLYAGLGNGEKCAGNNQCGAEDTWDL